MSLEKMGQAAREAAYQLATVSTAQKNRALAAIADELEARSAQILAANEKDIAAGRLVEKPLAEVRQELPINIAWRSQQVGRALAWFLERLADDATRRMLTAGI